MTPQEVRINRGIWLRNLRKQAGMSQNQLACYSKICTATIRNIENSHTGWTIDAEILYILGIEKYKKDCL